MKAFIFLFTCAAFAGELLEKGFMFVDIVPPRRVVSEAKSYLALEKKGRYTVHRELLPETQTRLGYPGNRWPEGSPLRKPLLRLYTAMEDCSPPLLHTLEKELHLAKNALRRRAFEADSLLQVGEIESGSALITLVLPEVLEFADGEGWKALECPAGKMVVIAGDKLPQSKAPRWRGKGVAFQLRISHPIKDNEEHEQTKVRH